MLVVWALGEDWMEVLAGVWLTGLGLVGFLMDRWLESVLCHLLFSSVVIGSVSKSLSMFVFSMSASYSSKDWSMLVVGLASDGFVLSLFVFVAEEVVVDILGEELWSVVVVGVIVVIVLSMVV